METKSEALKVFIFLIFLVGSAGSCRTVNLYRERGNKGRIEGESEKKKAQRGGHKNEKGELKREM